MDKLQTLAAIVAQIAGMMGPGVAITQGIVAAWSALKPLIHPSNLPLPPDPTPADLAALDEQIHAEALKAHEAWHRGDDDMA